MANRVIVELRNAPITMMAENLGMREITDLLVELYLDLPFTNIMGGMRSPPLRGVQPGRTANLRFTVDLNDEALR